LIEIIPELDSHEIIVAMNEGAESVLGIGEARLYALIEQSPDGIFVADLSGRYIYVNEAGCRLLGCSRDEIVGKTIDDFIAPEDSDRLARSKHEMLRGTSHVGEWKLRRKDGTWVPVEVNANILPDGQWQGFVRDISDRKAREAEHEALFRQIDAERRWLQTVLETVPVGVLLFAPDGRLFFNGRTEEMFGSRLSAAGGNAQYAERIRFPDGSPVPRSQLVSERVLRGGETVLGADLLLERPGGSRLPVIASGAPIRDTQGEISGGVVVFQDVSERMRAEDAIRRSERLLNAIFEILPVGVWIADEGGRIIRSNPAGQRIWGGAGDAALVDLGHCKGWWADTGKPVEAQDWALARALASGEASTGQVLRIECADESFKTIINSAAPLRDERSGVAGAICVNEDVSALYETQVQLRTAVRDRERILAVVSHDLRTPLNALMIGAVAVERLAAEIEGGKPVRSLAASLINITSRMAGLVDDLLAVAVARKGGRMLNTAPVSAAELLRRAADAARPLFDRQGIVLETRAIGALRAIAVDSSRLLRVFANLLDNALKFTEPSGRVVLAAEALSEGVRYSVANSGAALDAGQLDEMFQPFWQAEHDDSRGAGLGLSICRSIVEAHGGSIWAEAAPGMRVRICFLLPRPQPRRTKVTAAPSAKARS
jgi:PAS domain S-box-containing protein